MTTQLISAQLITRFNQAAALAREGNFDASLEAWENLLQGTPGAVLTGDFLGQLYMRKAWVLMDLGRYEEARNTFEDPVMQPCLGQFSTETLYECYYSYANTLGALGDIEGMDGALAKAMNLAADEIGDPARLGRCWNNLFLWAEKHEAWGYLLREVETCIAYADNYDSDLAVVARLNKALALARLGRKNEAAAIVKPIAASARADDNGRILAMCAEVTGEEHADG